MPDYYYIDLVFDCTKHPVSGPVQAIVDGLTCAGFGFVKITSGEPDTRGQVSFGEHVSLKPSDLGMVAEAYCEEMFDEGARFISFPPLGRVMFTFDFALDDSIIDDVLDDEDEAHASHRDVGLTFNVSALPGAGVFVRASVSFWEEYVLSHGGDLNHVDNMRSVLDAVRPVCERDEFLIGAANNEIRLNTDRALDGMMKTGDPSGNEFAFVGHALTGRLDKAALARRAFRTAPFARGMAIQYTNRWGGLSPL